MAPQYDFGMIGLGVMGSNLLLNIADHGFAAIGYDLKPERGQALEAAANAGTTVKGVADLALMVSQLKKPRKIMALVPAGAPVDAVIESLLPLLEEGDILIDGGNSFFKDTLRRIAYLHDKGIHFFGMGVSGGEMGARTGPSMMPGGDRAAYVYLKPILEAIAAKADGEPCVAYMGNGAAGHYVKMVHNGIEYAMMQMIAEAYDILHRGAGYSNEELHGLFSRWSNGPLNSFLISVTAEVLRIKDPETDKFLTDLILDKAGSKGTGKWTSQQALDLGVAIPAIDAAVAARTLSGMKEERVKASALYPVASHKTAVPRAELEELLEEALFSGFALAYAQGLSMLSKASDELGMSIPLPDVIKVWRAGCIIRSAMLGQFSAALDLDPESGSLLLNREIARLLKERENSLRQAITLAVNACLPVPALMSALAYYDAYRSERMSTNLIQAQRDYFGAHTYERIDKPGVFHTEWHAPDED
jgi:6-phosphogluconate dehydrogenase